MVNNINRELGMLKSKYEGPVSMDYYFIFSEWRPLEYLES